MPPGELRAAGDDDARAASFAEAGGLDGALLTSKQFYETDYTKPLLFMADGGVLSQPRRGNEHLLGSQWGMMNETGSYPGQVWLWLYTFWYQIKPFTTFWAANADIAVMAVMGVLSLALIFVPFLPGVRAIPRRIPIYKLIWRQHYRSADSIVLVPAEVPKGLLADSLPSALVTALHAHNDTHSGPEQIRLRMALHAGEVHYDQHGVTAAAVNLAFRLLDAGALKAALASSPGVLAVIASSWFYEEVVRHSPAAAAYRPVEVAVKETTTTGWVCLPDRMGPGGPGDAGAPARCCRSAGHAAGSGVAHAAARHSRVHRANRRAGPVGRCRL